MTTAGGDAPVRWIHGAPVAAELGLGSPLGRFATASGAAAAVRDDADEDIDADARAPREQFAPIEDRSLRLLGRRGLSRRELQRKLDDDEYPADEVANELDRLEGVGLIDDFALAQQLVVTLQERKGLGRGAIAAELAKRVVAPAAIAYALDLVDDGDELARARELAEKRQRSFGGLDRVTAQRRLSAYLMRRGFSGSAVRAAVDSVQPASGVRFR